MINSNNPERTAGLMLSQSMHSGVKIQDAKRSAYLMADAYRRGAVKHQETGRVLFWRKVMQIFK